MGKAQRDKGNRFERSIVNIFKAEGIPAKRVPLSGATEYAKGDVIAEVRGNEWRFELKVRGEGFKSLYSWLDDNDALIVKADNRRALVVMDLGQFMRLIEDDRPRVEIEIEEVEI